MKNTFQTILLSSIVCAVFVSGNYLHAQWSGPSSAPPDGNVAAPINTSSATQVKTGTGSIGAHNFHAFNRVIAEAQMRSPEYCDLNGQNCFSAADFQSLVAAVDGADGAPGQSNLDLVNGFHSSAQCESLGGQVVTDSSGNKFCRLNRTSCPTGWFQYENWRTTSSRTCRSVGVVDGFSCAPCTTGSDSWRNSASRPTCSYQGAYTYTSDFGQTTRCGGFRGGTLTCRASTSQIGCY